MVDADNNMRVAKHSTRLALRVSLSALSVCLGEAFAENRMGMEMQLFHWSTGKSYCVPFTAA